MRRAHLRGIRAAMMGVRVGLLVLSAGVLVWTDRRWDAPCGRIPNFVSLPLMALRLAAAVAL
ncbi:hypothetical protein HRbin22_01524 [Candidatus Thermoflexus japonica]|uniref:Uncharacterized protein n=1 Tax=Candidatus Thermoflexus japonica TaxID=2035417 RepID=A0A2H5Y768_9CHLR|nr:hypothetical protein HRbin22_01524 [Candidatus Thermoflexus japonica]